MEASVLHCTALHCAVLTTASLLSSFFSLPLCACVLLSLKRRQKVNPTVLTLSGYVFCYNCIMLHVKQHGTCPVTLVPAQEHHVRRLYFT